MLDSRFYARQTGITPIDGYAGFRMGRKYQLLYTWTWEFDEVRIAQDHAQQLDRLLTITR
jgi:hypothetical protein